MNPPSKNTDSQQLSTRRPSSSLTLSTKPSHIPIPPSLLQSPYLNSPQSIFQRDIRHSAYLGEADEDWLQDTVPLSSGVVATNLMSCINWLTFRTNIEKPILAGSDPPLCSPRLPPQASPRTNTQGRRRNCQCSRDYGYGYENGSSYNYEAVHASVSSRHTTELCQCSFPGHPASPIPTSAVEIGSGEAVKGTDDVLAMLADRVRLSPPSVIRNGALSPKKILTQDYHPYLRSPVATAYHPRHLLNYIGPILIQIFQKLLV